MTQATRKTGQRLLAATLAALQLLPPIEIWVQDDEGSGMRRFMAIYSVLKGYACCLI